MLTGVLVACGGSTGAGTDAQPSAADAWELPACDFTETEPNDLLRGGAVERTGHVASMESERFVVCGTLDPAQSTDSHFDFDGFLFATTGDGTASLRLEIDLEVATVSRVLVELWAARDTGGTIWDHGTHGDTHGVVVADVPTDSNYWLAVVGNETGARVTTPVAYRASVGPNRFMCDSPDTTPDYRERDESLDEHRANDTIGLLRGQATFTPEALDAPEDTGIVVGVGTTSVLAGHHAAVDRRGHYYDRDAYVVSVAEGVDELELVLEHDSAQAQPDVFVFRAGTLEEVSRRLVILWVSGTRYAMPVQGGQDYWVWVGGSAEGSPLVEQNYRLAMCGRNVRL